jgi:hypothetical protein
MIGRGQFKEGVDILETAYKESLEEEKSFKKKDLFYQIVQVYLENDLYPAVEKIYHEQIKYLNGHDCHQVLLRPPSTALSKSSLSSCSMRPTALKRKCTSSPTCIHRKM